MSSIPLAERLRPTALEEVVGQQHLIGPGKPLSRMVENERLCSMIFWGPPGTGKTTLANILATVGNLPFVSISAILSGVADLRKVFSSAEKIFKIGMPTLLFVDE